MGKIYLKLDRKYIQRYRCKTCKKSFINKDRLERNPKEKMYSSRKEIAEMYCMGMSLRDLSKKMNITRKTIDRKIELITEEINKKYKDFETFNFNSHHEENEDRRPIIVFDEMESYEHTKLKPLSISIAYDVINKKIIDIQVATFFPKGRFISTLHKKPHLRIKYELAKRYREDNRNEQMTKVLESVKNYIAHNKHKPLFITDGRAVYKTLLKEVFRNQNFVHEVIISKEMIENFVQTSKYGMNQVNIREKASFDALCATMRSKLSRLRRDSFIHTKKVNNLYNTLLLFMDFWNKTHSNNLKNNLDFCYT